MKYLSLCSGIEAASAAWKDLGWKPVAFSEIEPFPCAVLHHHFPDVPNLGDMTKIDSEPLKSQVSVIIGGTPCQSYSLAGARRGLDDERGVLSLHYARLINEINPKYFIWENVPGVLSDKGNAYGHFLSKLIGEELPLEPSGGKWTSSGWVHSEVWSLAWRVLDSQFFGVPQRRRRIFLVGCLREVGDAREILFEFESLHGNNSSSEEKRKNITAQTGESSIHPSDTSGTDETSSRRTSGRVESDVRRISNEERSVERSVNKLYSNNSYGGFRDEEVAPTLSASMDNTSSLPLVIPDKVYTSNSFAGYIEDNVAGTIRNASGDLGGGSENFVVYENHEQDSRVKEVKVCPTLNASMDNKSSLPLILYENHGTDSRVREQEVCPTVTARWGTGGNNIPLVHKDEDILVLNDQGGQSISVSENVVPTLRAETHGNNPIVEYCIQANTIRPDINSGGNGKGWSDKGIMYTLTTNDIHAFHVENPTGVRRLTPLEAERLQGFPDSWTDVPFRNKPATDTPRYKAIGNSMAVPVIKWMGERIQAHQDKIDKRWEGI